MWAEVCDVRCVVLGVCCVMFSIYGLRFAMCMVCGMRHVRSSLQHV